jgi:tetratricopeptide (TPR) repeat protein
MVGMDSGDWEADLKDQERALITAQTIVNGGKVDRDSLTGLAASHKKVGAVLLKTGRLANASAHYREALALDEKILAMDPRDPAARYDITFTLSDTGFTYWMLKDRPKALEYYRRVLAMREALVKEDPSNMRARSGVLSTCNYLGQLLREQGNWREAVLYHRRTIADTEEMLKSDASNADELAQLAWRHIGLGDDYSAGSRWQQAMESYLAAQTIAGDLKGRVAPAGADLYDVVDKRLAATKVRFIARR